jgi:hypothetical protein
VRSCGQGFGIDYGHKDGNISRGLWENHILYQHLKKKTIFTSLKSTAAPGDHFEVSVNVPVIISNSNLNWLQTSSM